MSDIKSEAAAESRRHGASGKVPSDILVAADCQPRCALRGGRIKNTATERRRNTGYVCTHFTHKLVTMNECVKYCEDGGSI